MYKSKLWDEDKWNIHSSGYSSSKYESGFSDKKSEEGKYHSSDYMRMDEHKEKEDGKAQDVSDDAEEKKEKELKEEQNLFKPKSPAHNEPENEKKQQKPAFSSIEDAIKKAIEGEKKIIMMDN